MKVIKLISRRDPARTDGRVGWSADRSVGPKSLSHLYCLLNSNISRELFKRVLGPLCWWWAKHFHSYNSLRLCMSLIRMLWRSRNKRVSKWNQELSKTTLSATHGWHDREFVFPEIVNWTPGFIITFKFEHFNIFISQLFIYINENKEYSENIACKAWWHVINAKHNTISKCMKLPMDLLIAFLLFVCLFVFEWEWAGKVCRGIIFLARKIRSGTTAKTNIAIGQWVYLSFCRQTWDVQSS